LSNSGSAVKLFRLKILAGFTVVYEVATVAAFFLAMFRVARIRDLPLQQGEETEAGCRSLSRRKRPRIPMARNGEF